MLVLIIENEEPLRTALREDLHSRGFTVHAFSDPVRALEFFSRSPVPLVVAENNLPNLNGLELLGRIERIRPGTSVILMTDYTGVSTRLNAIKQGAFDCLRKPFETEELAILLERAKHLQSLREENDRLRRSSEEHPLIGESETTTLLRNTIEIVAGTNVAVLLSGETGTGKDLTARKIHEAGPRGGAPFLKISCGQYHPDLLGNELFGTEPAGKGRSGQEVGGSSPLLRQGTVYLDDVDELTPDLQVGLLRVLDRKARRGAGSAPPSSPDIRIIASTKRDLPELIRQGRFRSDLHDRLSAFTIHLPPLRHHKEDIVRLARHFWDKMGHPEKALGNEALDLLEAYDWPGNVRELKNVVERLAISCRSQFVSSEDIPSEMRQPVAGGPAERPVSFDEVIASTERKLLTEALRRSCGNQSQAARSLGMKLSTLRGRLAKYAIPTHTPDRKTS